MKHKIRILLVDDEAGVRRGLRMSLGFESDLEIVGEAANGREAFEAVGRLAPDLVLMDARMPEVDGVQATAQIRKAFPHTKVIVMTMYDDGRMRMAALRAGAGAFIAKHQVDEALLPAIYALATNGSASLDQS